jgi:hypothetical protein
MKAIFAICALSLVFGGFAIWRTVRQPSRYGEFTGAAEVQVDDLAGRPQAYLHKTVRIQGEVRQQCTAMGCFFFFFAGKTTLRVDLEEIAMHAPRREGRAALVEGQIVPYGDGYQLLATAVEFR